MSPHVRRLALPAAVLPVAATLAALDALLVRLALPHRPTEPRLFVEALVLWLAFVLLALVPAGLTRRLLRRLRGRRADGAEPAPAPERAVALLLGWAVLPVAAHALLDRHTGLGTDLGGRVSGLASPWPWLQLLLLVAAGVLVLRLAAPLLQRAGSGRGAALVVLVATLVGVFLPLRSQGAAPRTPALAAEGEQRPNLLLLVWDTCRMDRLEAYDYERPTSPHLAQLARDALVLEEARSASVFTFSSHLSLLTGVYPSRHGGRLLETTYDPRRADTIAAELRAAGWRTGAFVGTDVLAGRTGIRYGFETYDDRVDPPVCDTRGWRLVHDVQSLLAARFVAFRNDGMPHWFQDFQRPAEEVLARALEWIERDDPRPWFCMINLYDVHWPYTPDPESAALLVRPYDGPVDGYLDRSDRWREGYEPTDEDARHLSDLYEAEILALDAAVDRFLARLDLERTALVLTSDHGEAFGEAGEWKHENITEPQVRVPLLVRPPGGLAEGRRLPARASGIDVAPTLLALAGLGPPAGLDGADLLELLTRPDALDERPLLVEDRDHVDPTDVRVALYRGPWKLVRHGLGEDERFQLHDLRTDPIGERDVSAEHPDVLAELRALLAELRAAGDRADRHVEGQGGVTSDALRGLGYVGG